MMKNKKFISILLILLCLSLCVGLTYAYFTDSATSKGNKIQAGKLKIDLELLNKDTLIWNSIKESQDPIFYYEKWEPGYTDVKLLKIDNEETLAIQWEARFIYEGQLPALANAIEVYVKTSDSEFAYPTSRDDFDLDWKYEGTLAEFAANISTILKGKLLSGESDYFGIALYMPATVEDNDLQGESINPFDIQILATQLAHESDAFDESYDADAGFPTDDIEPTDSDIFTWSENGDGTYTVTGFKAGVTIPRNLVIPSTYNGGRVTTIGDYAFYHCYDLAELTIPDSVTIIGRSAFEGCSGLTSIEIPNSVTYIGSQAFVDCYSLEYNEYDNARYLGNASNPYVVLMSAIDTSLTLCDIHNNTKIIYHNAFQYCYSLSGELAIPNGVTQIGNSAFDNCYNLTGDLVIPDSVTTIGTYALSNCYNLTSVTIGDSVTTIGDFVFYHCSNLTSVTIPDSVTTIGDFVFYHCSNLTSVTIPDSVTTIGDDVFKYCSNLTSVTIGDSVTTIGERVFYDCSNLTSIIVDGKNEAYQSINGNLYSKDGTVLIAYAIGKTDISFAIPDSVTTIGAYAFSNCYNLTSVTIGDSVTTIGDEAFRACSNLTSVTIGDSVITIGNEAFRVCSKLTSIVVDEKNEAYQSINGNLYSKDGTVLVAYAIGKADISFAIPDSVTTIGDSAFSNCSNLTSVTIPDSVTTIGDYAFFYCDNLTSVTIGNAVTTIGNSAFEYCDNLTSVTIGDSVTTIGDWAFNYCYKLVEVINKSSLNIAAGAEDNGYVAYYAKEVHNGTTKIVNQNNYLFYTYNGVNYLLGYVGTDTTLTLPENYNGQNYEIHQWAFYDEPSNLTSVTIPDSVTAIGDYAFYYCPELTSVTIGNSVTTIGDYAFEWCERLTSITFDGTIEQWNAIELGYDWDYATSEYTIYCTDGTIAKNGTVTYY